MECIRSNLVSVVVNGSPTEEFKAQSGLRQGDPLPPFLFIMVGEALTSLIRKGVEEGFYRRYKVSDTLSYPILQFTDDTILLCCGGRDNRWSLKVILRSFE